MQAKNRKNYPQHYPLEHHKPHLASSPIYSFQQNIKAAPSPSARCQPTIPNVAAATISTLRWKSSAKRSTADVNKIAWSDLGTYIETSFLLITEHVISHPHYLMELAGSNSDPRESLPLAVCFTISEMFCSRLCIDDSQNPNQGASRYQR